MVYPRSALLKFALSQKMTALLGRSSLGTLALRATR